VTNPGSKKEESTSNEMGLMRMVSSRYWRKVIEVSTRADFALNDEFNRLLLISGPREFVPPCDQFRDLGTNGFQIDCSLQNAARHARASKNLVDKSFHQCNIDSLTR